MKNMKNELQQNKSTIYKSTGQALQEGEICLERD